MSVPSNFSNPNNLSNSANNNEKNSVVSAISDLTYRNYDGPLQPPLNRWWVVALATIRINIKKPAFWVNFGFIMLIYLIYALILYFTKNVTDNMSGAMGGGGGANAKEMADRLAPLKGPGNIYAQSLWLALSQSHFFLFLMALTVGSGSIASDNQANALLVYLSKPLTKLDYLVGKWMGIFLLLAGAYVLPPIFMYVFYVAGYYSEGFLKDHASLFPRLVLASFIAPIVQTSLILGISAWSKSGRAAGAIYAGLYIGLNTLALVLGTLSLRNTRLDEDMGTADRQTYQKAFTIMNCSLSGVGNGIASALLDTNGVGRLDPPRLKDVHPNPLPLALIGGVLVLLPVLGAAQKIRAVEIVKG